MCFPWMRPPWAHRWNTWATISSIDTVWFTSLKYLLQFWSAFSEESKKDIAGIETHTITIFTLPMLRKRCITSYVKRVWWWISLERYFRYTSNIIFFTLFSNYISPICVTIDNKYVFLILFDYIWGIAWVIIIKLIIF